MVLDLLGCASKKAVANPVQVEGPELDMFIRIVWLFYPLQMFVCDRPKCILVQLILANNLPGLNYSTINLVKHLSSKCMVFLDTITLI